MVAARLGAPGSLADGRRDARSAPAAPTNGVCRRCRWLRQVLGDIRKKKSEEQRPLKTPVARVVIRAPEDKLALLADIERDLRASGQIQQIEPYVSEACRSMSSSRRQKRPPDAGPE